MVQAKKDSQNWIVDNENGYIVIHPDTLISTTTIVGGLHCNRQAVLSEIFKKIESLPYLISSQTALTIGKIVHGLLQKVSEFYFVNFLIFSFLFFSSFINLQCFNILEFN